MLALLETLSVVPVIFVAFSVLVALLKVKLLLPTRLPESLNIISLFAAVIVTPTYDAQVKLPVPSVSST